MATGCTGYNSDETAVNPTTAPHLHVLWTFPTGGRINAQPIVENGSLSFGSWDGKEYDTDISGSRFGAPPSAARQQIAVPQMSLE